jgi:hypothetical protein
MEHFQIYLTLRVQDYFSIPAKDIMPDSQADLSGPWHTLWRIDHLTCNNSETQHLFLATNAASLYSFIIPLLAEENFDRLISLFYQHWYDTVISHGLLPPMPAAVRTEYLRGRPNALIGSMNQIVDHALMKLHDKQLSVKETHIHIRSLPFRKIGWSWPNECLRELIDSAPPYPPIPRSATGFPMSN